jgi:uncharacterized protein YbbK (DUF523 family)
VRIGVSACLLGQPVRYDGGHRRDAFLVDVLGPRVEFVPVCPEVELGLGTPRETLRLVRRAEDVRMIMANGVDYTDAMRAYAARRVEALAGERLSGYVLKSRSPSCGLVDAAVVPDAAPGAASPEDRGRGLFAAALVARFPDLPIEDELGLADPATRERFLARVFGYGKTAPGVVLRRT